VSCRLSLGICLSTLAFACSAGAALAQSVTPGSHLGAVDVFDLAARAADVGQIDEALKLYDALSNDPDVEIRCEALFRKGQLLASQQRLREAALAYRQLLDEKPEAARVRLELAALLARMGDETGARRELRRAQAAGLPPDVAEQVTQFSSSLRSPKRFGGSLELTLAPDSNINRGTQARTLDTVIAPLVLSNDARETSGLGLRLRTSGFFKQPFRDGISLVARASGSADLYRGGSTNDLLAATQLGSEWRGERDQVSLAYGFSKRWYGGAAFADTRFLTGEWLHQIDRVTQLSSSISRGVIHYRRNTLQDGKLYDGSLSVERAFSAKSGGALGVSVARQDALDPSYASWAAGPLVYAWHDLGLTTLFAAASGRRLIGDERNFLFNGKRDEWFLSGRAGAIFRRWSIHGFSPTMRLGYERNRSTISIYDYQRIFVEFGIAQSF
jgi:tetratricopeptide (TPR) repeat protein